MPINGSDHNRQIRWRTDRAAGRGQLFTTDRIAEYIAGIIEFRLNEAVAIVPIAVAA